MSTSGAYERAVSSYADVAESLLGRTVPPQATLPALAPQDQTQTAEEAEQLLALSSELTRLAEARLQHPDPGVRGDVAAQLLAKALLDLTVSARLLQAAMSAEAAGGADQAGALPLWVASADDVQVGLRALRGEPELWPSAQRDEVAPTNLATARMELSNAVTDGLKLISERAAFSGQAAVGGLLGVGVAEVAQAAGIVGMNLAEALGQAEKVGRLFSAFRDFAAQSYDSMLVMLGRQLAQQAASRVVEWLNKLKEGALFASVLEDLYETKRTSSYLQKLVADSAAELVAFTAAIEGIDTLDESYRRQADLARRLLTGLTFFGALPMAILPQPRVFVALGYILVGGYVVLCGGDYVDAPRLRMLDRIPGMRRVAERHLLPSPQPSQPAPDP
jgi:hypothetical protein